MDLRVLPKSEAVSDTITVGTQTLSLDLPDGNYLRVELLGVDADSPATLTVLGQTISGRFVFEQTTTADNQRVVTIAVTDVEIHIGTGEMDIIAVTDGQALFLIAPLAGLRLRGPVPGIDARMRDVVDQVVRERAPTLVDVDPHRAGIDQPAVVDVIVGKHIVLGVQVAGQDAASARVIDLVALDAVAGAIQLQAIGARVADAVVLKKTVPRVGKGES